MTVEEKEELYKLIDNTDNDYLDIYFIKVAIEYHNFTYEQLKLIIMTKDYEFKELIMECFESNIEFEEVKDMINKKNLTELKILLEKKKIKELFNL